VRHLHNVERLWLLLLLLHHAAFPLQPDSSDGRLRLVTGIISSHRRSGSDDGAENDHGIQQCLLPWVDMLNHRDGAPVIWQSSPAQLLPGGGVTGTGRRGGGSGSGAGLRGCVGRGGGGGGGGSVGIAVGSAVARGGEVCNNYGPKSNEEWLRNYGFCLAGNRHDVFHLEVSQPAGHHSQACSCAHLGMHYMRHPVVACVGASWSLLHHVADVSTLTHPSLEEVGRGGRGEGAPALSYRGGWCRWRHWGGWTRRSSRRSSRC
jgi:hypothetical protein